MLSQLAKEDLQDLRDEGLQPTDEDVIRLHALALRLTDGPETTAANAPRFAVVGGVTFWEPTCAALEWYRFAKTFAADEEIDEWMFAFAIANGRKVRFLENLRDRDDINRELGKFIASIAATEKEVESAVYYATTGYDDIKADETDLAKKTKADKTNAQIEEERFAAIERKICKAAAKTGLTMDDILGQTPDRLTRMIYAAHVQAGMELTSGAASAHADYLATKNAIRKRLIAERDEKARQAGAPSSPSPAM